MPSINKSFLKILNRGTNPNTGFDDLKRIRLLNTACLLGLFFTPIMFAYNYSIGNPHELMPLILFFIYCWIAFLLNKKGKNQLAAIIAILGAIITSYWVVSISTTQVGAPYFNILFGLLALYMIKNKILKTIMVLISFTSFIVLNGYQLYTRPFNLEEYAPVIFLMIIIYIGLTSYDRDYQRNQQKIKQQSDSLIKLEKDKHRQELVLKQKDIETVLANNQMQLKIRQNILSELETIKSKEDSLKKISSLKMDLKSMIETQKKLDFTQQNYEEVNAQFYEKLTSQHPNLTKKEKELCTYIRLGLSTKEMSTLTNSTENALYVTKNRLRKKLALDESTQINSYLLNL